MTNSPGQPPRERIAPPESTGRPQRKGYFALAASGLALCTVFATIAQLSQPDEPTTQRPVAGTNQPAGGATQLVPGQAVPAEATVIIDGVAVTGPLPSSSDAPTTIVTTDEHGNPRTSVHSPTHVPSTGGPSSSTDGGGDSSHPAPPSSSTSTPGPNPSNTPPQPPEPPPSTNDPEPPPSTPNPIPATMNPTMNHPPRRVAALHPPACPGFPDQHEPDRFPAHDTDDAVRPHVAGHADDRVLTLPRLPSPGWRNHSGFSSTH